MNGANTKALNLRDVFRRFPGAMTQWSTFHMGPREEAEFYTDDTGALFADVATRPWSTSDCTYTWCTEFFPGQWDLIA